MCRTYGSAEIFGVCCGWETSDIVLRKISMRNATTISLPMFPPQFQTRGGGVTHHHGTHPHLEVITDVIRGAKCKRTERVFSRVCVHYSRTNH